MYKTACANACGREVFVFAKNKGGELPKAYCSKKCEGEAKDLKRFVKLK